MANKIIKDIRIYESDKPNIAGNSLPGELGQLVIPTKDTTFIAQRIARKLNELKAGFGEFDHIYINLTSVLNENELVISDRDVMKAIKYVDVGIKTENLKKLSNSEMDHFIKTTIFKVLKTLGNGENLELINQTEKLIDEFGTELKIHYKTKETTSYKIDIFYEIQSAKGGTNAIVEFTDKKNNKSSSIKYPLHFYSDIYPLIDTATLKGGAIIFKPKKSFTASLYNSRYKTPIKLNLSDFS